MSEAERDYVAEAAEQGWVDVDEWRGDPEKHVPAQVFVERGEKIAGILKSKNDRLEGRLAKLEESNRKFGEYHKQTLEQQRTHNAEKIADLENQLDQAVTDGDGKAHRLARKEIEAIKENAPVPIGDSQQWDQMAEQWAGDNSWYNDNPKLHNYANDISDRLRAEGYVGHAYFTELTRSVKETFPEDFKNPNKSKASATDSSGQLSTKDSKAHTYDNLDAVEKAACDGFVADGFMTREDYVKNYEWEA